MIIGMMTYAQNMVFEPVGKAKSSNKVIEMIIEGVSFDVTVTSTGNYKIPRISEESGNQYWYYFGYITEWEYDSKPVFTNKKKSEYWYMSIGETGYPTKVKLKVKSQE